MSYSRRALTLISAAIEALILLMVCASPWALGSVGVVAKLYLLIGVAVLLALWLLRLLFTIQIDWRNCPVAICLAATILLGVFQLAPIGRKGLTWISPGTANLYGDLLPIEPESLDPKDSLKNVAWANAGSTISLYPGETRKSLVPFLAIFALFLVVRNNKLSQAGVRRLCIALLINGAALALFGLVQHFSTPERGKIYWTYQTLGSSFGPFINRNHFAFYLNMCVGPALGLLLSYRSNTSAIDQSWSLRLLSSFRDMLLTPASLWIVGGLALMIASVTFCLSRGGVVAMLASGTACLLLALFVGSKNLRLFSTVLSAAAAGGLLMWFGMDSIEARLSTLWDGEALEDGRVFVMSRCWPLVSQFPVFGTGMGTFQFVEPLALHTPQDVGTVYEHAHNDYLEDLIEGGAVRLLLRLVAMAFTLRFAFVAYRKHAGEPLGALTLGLLFAFTSVLIHSFFEFGLYASSIAVLATVVCGNLCNLGEKVEPVGQADSTTLGIQRIGILGGFICVVLFGWFFWTEGSKAVKLRKLEDEINARREAAIKGVEDLTTEIPLLYKLANLDPFNAEQRFAVAQSHFYLYKRIVVPPGNQKTEESRRRQLESALQHTIHARNLCPLLPEPHTKLAAHIGAFAKADSKNAYMNRAKQLAPSDPQLWYICGLQELADKQPEEAWASWKQSLQLSEIGLTRILDRAITTISPEEILQKLLPNRPSILTAAATYLYPDPEAVNERRPMLEKAMSIYSSQPIPLSPVDQHGKAMVLKHLNQPNQAIEAYRIAIEADPQKVAWRFELVMLLLEQGQSKVAKNELGQILGQEPNHHEARQLLEVLRKEEP